MIHALFAGRLATLTLLQIGLSLQLILIGCLICLVENTGMVVLDVTDSANSKTYPVCDTANCFIAGAMYLQRLADLDGSLTLRLAHCSRIRRYRKLLDRKIKLQPRSSR
jgi:hypothetical protein